LKKLEDIGWVASAILTASLLLAACGGESNPTPTAVRQPSATTASQPTTNPKGVKPATLPTEQPTQGVPQPENTGESMPNDVPSTTPLVAYVSRASGVRMRPFFFVTEWHCAIISVWMK